MAHQPGPNDFHYDNGILKSGLGADEPTDTEYERLKAAAREREEIEAALARAKQQIEDEAASLDAKRAEIEQREQALLERERQLAELASKDVAAADASAGAAAQRRPTARQATERVGS